MAVWYRCAILLAKVGKMLEMIPTLAGFARRCLPPSFSPQAMMTLRNMRENGVRSLAITCGAVWCNHQAVLDADAFCR
jgi:hypothetical protein